MADVRDEQPTVISGEIVQPSATKTPPRQPTPAKAPAPAKAQRAVDALLAESRKGARSVGGGRFRLDFERALDKIKRFQLTDPHRYVLELVQGAVAAGATSIRVDMDADDMHMRFDASYSAEELERLFDYVFVSDPAHARLSQLAVGVNAALALRPKSIVVESGDGTDGAALALSTHENAAVSARSGADAIDGTHIHVRERTSFKVLLDALRGNAEERIIAEHCTRCRVPLLLQGLDVRRPLASDAIASVRLQDDSGRTIELALPRAPLSHSRITLAKNGVSIVRASLDDSDLLGALGVVGHLDDPRLSLNASRSDVQRDASYTRMLRQLRGAAYQMTVEALSSDAHKRLAPGARRRWMRDAAVYLRGGQPDRPEVQGNSKLARALDVLLDEPDLIELAYYEASPTGGRARPARGALRSFVALGAPVRRAPRRFELTQEDVSEGALRSVAYEPERFLSLVFRCAISDATSDMLPLEQTAKRRAARRARRSEARLPPSSAVLVRAAVESVDPPIIGEIGLNLREPSEDDARGVLVTFLRDGVPLDEVLIKDKLLDGVAVFDSPQFEPTPDWARVKHNAAYRSLGKVLGRTTLDLCAAIASSFASLPPPPELTALGIWDAEGGARVEANRSGLLFGWPRDATSTRARAVTERLLLKMPRLSAERAPWLWRWPIFCTLDGKATSLDELRQAAPQSGVCFVKELPWGATQVDEAQGTPIVNLTAQQRRILRKYLPAGTRSLDTAVKKRRAWLEQQAAIASVRGRNILRSRSRRGAPELSRHAMHVVLDLPIDSGIIGQIGLLRSPRVSTLRVYVDDEEHEPIEGQAPVGLPLLEELSLDVPVALQACALSPDIEADERFFGPVRGPALTQLISLVRGQVEPLLCAMVQQRGDRLGPSERDVLWTYLIERQRKTGRGLLELPDVIEQAPLLETVSHGSKSLAEARAEVALHGDVLVVSATTARAGSEAAPQPRVDKSWWPARRGKPSPDDADGAAQLIERPLVVCDGDVRSTLAQLIDGNLRTYDERLVKERAAIARSRAPRESARLAEGHLIKVAIVGPDISGELAADLGSAMGAPRPKASVRVLTDGRPLQTREIGLGGLAAVGVISSARFAPDRMFTRVRDDAGWRDGERALRSAADRLIARCCEVLARGQTPAIRRSLTSGERDALAAALQNVAADRFRGDPSVDLSGATDADWALAHAPAWPLCPSGTFGGLVDLARSVRESGVLLFVRTSDGHPATGRVIARAPGETTRRALLAVFSGVIARGDATLERDEAAYQRKQAAPLARTGLIGSLTFAATPIEWRGAADRAVDGEVGLARAAEGAPSPGLIINCASEGREFRTWTAHTPLAARAVVDCRGLSADWADATFTDAEDVALIERLASEGMWRAVAELARGAKTLTRWRPADHAQRRHLLVALAAAIPMPSAPAGVLELLAMAPLFVSTGGQQLTAQQVLGRTREDGRLLVVSDELPPGDPPDGRLIIRADEQALAALQALTGEQLQRHDEVWAEELRGMERRQLAQPSAPHLESDSPVISSSFSRGDISGMAGLLMPSIGAAERSRVRLHVGRRLVAERHPEWQPSLEIWINCDRMTPTRAFDDVIEDDVFDEVMATAEAQICDMVARAVESEGFDFEPRLRRAARTYVVRNFTELRRARDEDEDEAARVLLAAPIWQCNDSEREKHISSDELHESLRIGRVASVERAERRLSPDGGPLLLRVGPDLAHLWGQTLGAQLPDYTAKLEALEARRRFLAQPQVKHIDLATCDFERAVYARGEVGEVEGRPHDGEIGLAFALEPQLRIIAYADDRRVGAINVMPSRVPAVAAVQGPSVKLSARAELDRDCLGWHELLTQLRRRAEQLLISTLHDEKATSQAQQAARRTALSVLGLLERELLEREMSMKRKKGRSKGKPEGKRKSARDLDLHESDAALAAALRSAPLVRALDGRALSINELLDAQPVGTISPQADQGPEPEMPGTVVVVESPQATALTTLVGARDVEGDYTALVQARRRREAAPDRADVDWKNAVVRASFSHGALRGELGLGVPFGRRALTLMSRGRVVETIQPEAAMGLIGWLDGPLETDPRFSHVFVDMSLREAIGELHQARLEAAVQRCIDERARARPHYRALAAYTGHFLVQALDAVARTPKGRREVVLAAPPLLDALARQALEAQAIEDVDGRFYSLRELAAREITFVCCPPEAGESGADRGAVLLLRGFGSTLLETLLLRVHDEERVVSLAEWRRRSSREAKARRAAEQRMSSNDRVLGGLRAALREGARVSDGRGGLTLTLANALTLAREGRRRSWLTGPGGVECNPQSSVWRAATAAEAAGVRSSYHLAASLLCHSSESHELAEALAALAGAALE